MAVACRCSCCGGSASGSCHTRWERRIRTTLIDLGGRVVLTGIHDLTRLERLSIVGRHGVVGMSSHVGIMSLNHRWRSRSDGICTL